MGSEIKKRFQSKSWGVEKYASEIEIKKELYMIIEISHAYVPFLTQGVGDLFRSLFGTWSKKPPSFGKAGSDGFGKFSA